MRRGTATNWLSVRSPGDARCLRARRVAWLVLLLVAASLAEGSLANRARGSGAGLGPQQVFRLGRSQLAPTRAG